MSPELSSYDEAQLRRAGVDLRDREAVGEHILWLESILNEIRWPIDDDGYLESVDADAGTTKWFGDLHELSRGREAA